MITRFLPARFASYIAWSARATTCPSVSPGSTSATPAENLMGTGPERSANGSAASVPCNRRAICAASHALAPGSSNTNSSPP